MTAPPRRRGGPSWPDPCDPANDAWWQARDRLEAIASSAAAIAAAARAAQHAFQAGQRPHLDDLAAQLGRWWWDRGSLDPVSDYDPAPPPHLDSGKDPS